MNPQNDPALTMSFKLRKLYQWPLVSGEKTLRPEELLVMRCQRMAETRCSGMVEKKE
jgi:hypothetical protein